MSAAWDCAIENEKLAEAEIEKLKENFPTSDIGTAARAVTYAILALTNAVLCVVNRLPVDDR